MNRVTFVEQALEALVKFGSVEASTINLLSELDIKVSLADYKLVLDTKFIKKLQKFEKNPEIISGQSLRLIQQNIDHYRWASKENDHYQRIMEPLTPNKKVERTISLNNKKDFQAQAFWTLNLFESYADMVAEDVGDIMDRVVNNDRFYKSLADTIGREINIIDLRDIIVPVYRLCVKYNVTKDKNLADITKLVLTLQADQLQALVMTNNDTKIIRAFAAPAIDEASGKDVFDPKVVDNFYDKSGLAPTVAYSRKLTMNEERLHRGIPPNLSEEIKESIRKNRVREKIIVDIENEFLQQIDAISQADINEGGPILFYLNMHGDPEEITFLPYRSFAKRLIGLESKFPGALAKCVLELEDCYTADFQQNLYTAMDEIGATYDPSITAKPKLTYTAASKGSLGLNSLKSQLPLSLTHVNPVEVKFLGALTAGHLKDSNHFLPSDLNVHPDFGFHLGVTPDVENIIKNTVRDKALAQKIISSGSIEVAELDNTSISVEHSS